VKTVIDFTIDRTSGQPTYLQLAQQVRRAVRLGLLLPGDQLPTARQVVDALGINPNTVLKAYRELARDGSVTARPGLGTFMAGSFAGPDRARLGALQLALQQWMRDAHAAGFASEDIEALIYATIPSDAPPTGG
jgi:GntR family transcriptional regulator